MSESRELTVRELIAIAIERLDKEADSHEKTQAAAHLNGADIWVKRLEEVQDEQSDAPVPAPIEDTYEEGESEQTSELGSEPDDSPDPTEPVQG